MNPEDEDVIYLEDLMGPETPAPLVQAPAQPAAPQPAPQPRSGIGSDAPFAVTRGAQGQQQFVDPRQQAPVNTPVPLAERPDLSVGEVPGARWTPADNVHEPTPVDVSTPSGEDDVLYIEDLMGPQARKYTFLGSEIPEPVNDAISPFMDTVSGMWDTVADILEIPVNDVKVMLSDIGAIDDSWDPDRTKDQIVKWLEDHKIGADRQQAFSEFWADVGESAAAGLTIMGLMMIGAPSGAALPAATGAGVRGVATNTIRNLSTELLARPGMAVTTELGAAVGGELGADVGEAIYGPNGEVIGRTAGAILGGGATAVAQDLGAKAAGAGKGAAVGAAVGAGADVVGLTAGTGAGAIGGAAYKGVRGWRRAGKAAQMERVGRAAGIPDTPIIEKPSPELAATVHDYATKAVARDQIKTEALIQNVINRVSVSEDPIREAERVRSALKTAYTKAQQTAAQKWAQIDQSRPMRYDEVAPVVKEVVASVHPSKIGQDLPAEIIGDIQQFLRVQGRVQKDGTIKITHQPKVKDFLAIHSKIQTEFRKPDFMSDAMRANLVKLDTAILDSMAKQYPADKTLAEAREYTRWLHNRFTNSDIGTFMGRGRGRNVLNDPTQGDLSNPATMLDNLIRKEKAGSMLSELSSKLDMPSLARRSEEFIRARFRQEGERLDALDAKAQAGQRYLQRKDIQRYMRQMPETAARLQIQSDRLNRVLAIKKQNDASAFHRLAHDGAQETVSRMYNARNKEEVAQQIMSRVKQDPEALSAFKSTVVEELYRRAHGNPKTMNDYLQSKDIQPMLATVLGYRDFGRLIKLTRTAAQYQGGAPSMGAKLVRKAVPVLTRVGVLRSLPAQFSLQERSLLSNLTRDITEGILSDMDPGQLYSHAVINPYWERILYAKLPENVQEAEWLEKALRTAISSTHASLGLLPENEDE